ARRVRASAAAAAAAAVAAVALEPPPNLLEPERALTLALMQAPQADQLLLLPRMLSIEALDLVDEPIVLVGARAHGAFPQLVHVRALHCVGEQRRTAHRVLVLPGCEALVLLRMRGQLGCLRCNR